MNRLLKAAAALLCVAGLSAYASTSNLTATLTDSDGQTWNGAQWSAVLMLTSYPFGSAVPTVGGVPVSPVNLNGYLSSSGVLTGAFTDTSTVDQAGARWFFTFCSNTSAPQCTVIATPVVGATPDLSAIFSPKLIAPRFSAIAGSFGYRDVEVTNPTRGAQYYNVIIGALRQYNGTGWTGVGAASAPVGLVAFGDSLSAYTGATTPSLGFLSLERNQIGGHVYDGYIYSGDQLLDLNKWQYQAGSPFVGGPNTQIEIGTNDVTVYGSSANLETVFQRVYHGSLLWGAIPISNKVYAQTCTKTTGFGTADNTYLYGLGELSTTQNDVLTCTVTTGPNGDIAIGYMIYNGDAGTFTVKVNGTLQADPLTASTTWIAYGDGSSTITTTHGHTQGVAGAVLTGFPANTAATVTFTVTSASSGTNIVEPMWVGSFPAASTANPYVIAISPNHQNNANDALSSTYAGFISSLVSTDVGYGLNAIYVDTRDALGTNYATYYYDALHPNNAGHALMASTIINTLPSALVTSAPPNLFEGIFNSYQRNSIAPPNPMNFPNLNPYYMGDGVNLWSPGISLGGRGGGMSWISADGVRGAYIAGWNGLPVSLCTGNSPYPFYYYPSTPSQLGSQCALRVNAQNVVDVTAAKYLAVGAVSTQLGTAYASAATIAPNNTIFLHITGTAAISNITQPIASGCIYLIPDGAWTTTTTGNIAVASTAVVGRVLTECFDGTKWYPSY